ncbi:MAG: lysylphosphatidylglycerol synthase transmembrane domain-containing protein [Candidatus Hodarchaeota archaeon]
MKRFIPAAVGLIIFLYILWWVGTSRVLDVLRNISLSYFLGSAILMSVSYVIKFLRWVILVKGKHTTISVPKLFPVFAVNYGLSVSFPSKTGDLAGLEVSRRYAGIPIGDGASFVVFYRIYDIVFVLVAATVSSYSISGLINIEWLEPTLVLCTIILILLFFLLLFPPTSEKMADFLSWLLNKIFRSRVAKFRQRIRTILDDYLKTIRFYSQKKVTLLTVACLTGVRWLLEFAAFSLMLKSAEITVSFGFTALILSLRLIITILTMVPFGLGTSLIPTIVILDFLGASRAAVVVVDVLSNLIGPILIALIGMICAASLREHDPYDPSKITQE